ncbi:MAG TPA: protein kinase [Ktedonobacteraceae bacterium]|nr:protein kinase [Ktedonobacteraceae bacterium]
MADYTGQRLGNYQLSRLLGEGGFAQVYLGEHVYLGTQAAIKVLNAQLGNDLDWFLKEARTIARLVHPNIVRVLEFGVEPNNNTPFLVMDYAPKGTLRQRHSRGTFLPVPTVVSYAKQVAEALQYAHDEKLVHRDVKPENMLLGKNDEVLLSDFGIALMAQTAREPSLQDVAGTLAYTAPEQIQGQPRRASDQYSLGIVVYEWLAGELPFKGSLTEVIAQQLTVTPPPLLTKRPTLSPAIEQVVLTALEKDPDKRFGSVRAFALALEQASQLDASPYAQQPITPTVPAGPAPNTISPSRRSVAPPVKQAAPLTPTVLPPIPPAVQAQPVGSVICNYREHVNEVHSLSWFSDSRRIVTASNDKTVHVWDAMTGNRLQLYRDISDAVRVVAASSDGSRIATAGSDAMVRVWDFATNRLIATYRGHVGNTINAIAWSPTQQLLASAASDGTVHVWNLTTGQPLAIYRGHTGSVNTLAWEPSSSLEGVYRIVSGGDDMSVQTWNAATGRTVMIYRGQRARVQSVAWSPNVYPSSSSPNAPRSSRVGCGREDGMVQMWDTTTDREALSYRYSAPLSVVAWSPDGRRFAYASDAQTVEVWDTTTNLKLVTFSHTTPPRVMAWSPDGKYIASGGGDATIQVWVAP